MRPLTHAVTPLHLAWSFHIKAPCLPVHLTDISTTFEIGAATCSRPSEPVFLAAARQAPTLSFKGRDLTLHKVWCRRITCPGKLGANSFDPHPRQKDLKTRPPTTMTETTSSPSAIPVAYEADVALLHSDARSNGEADLDFSPTHQGKLASLEENYKKVTGSRPPLQEQGSDAFLSAQFKLCEKGEIGFFHTKQMVSAMPDPLEMAATVNGLKPINGFLYQEDQEERKSPYSKEQWESVLTVFQTNLLMCVWAFPNNRLFDLEKSDMDAFYKFLLGDEIAKRSPAPELKVLMHAERAAWRKVALHMHEGLSLKTSLDKVMSNSIFWTREVYEKGESGPKGKGKDKGKAKAAWLAKNGKQEWYPNYEAVKEEGKGKGKGTAKAEAAAAARARSRTPTPGPAAAGGGKWPAEWAEATAKGQQFCKNFHLRSCAIKCGRSHNCPVYKTDGTVCNGGRKAFDIDSEFPLELRHGVPLGVDEETLCSPGVWPTKEELKGQLPEYEDLPPPGSMDNYSSAVLHEDAIEATFYEEEKLDMVIGLSSIEDAAITCGCLPEDLCAGPLGAVEEADKLRTIFDGAAPGVNDHIRKNTKEKTTCPGATGPETAWEEEEWVLLKADVTKAHRRVKISRKGWKYQIAIVKGKYWVNKVGTYGVVSAQLYWGRLAALMLRLLYYMYPGLDWAFVYVDDFAFLIRRRWANKLAWALLATIAALGCPLSWKKTIMGLVNTWLGFQIQAKLPAAAVGHLKHRVMVALLKDISDGKRFSYDEIAEGLGRLQWATNAFPLVKPFLQPFWAWKTAVVTASFPSRLLRMIAKVILLLINSVITSTSPFCPTSSTHVATDAVADDTTATIGGWFSDLQNPRQVD
ncbi:unnamed protein product, partial [Polarella glacialis]